MSSSDTTADKFVLLFSADWFHPHWALTGFIPKDGDSAAFQHEIRNLVGRMMDDASCYWHISFSEERIADTREALLDALTRHGGEGSNLALIRALVMGDEARDALTDISMAFWDNYEATLDEIRRANLKATAWDGHLTGLTPDLPSLSQDFVCVDVLRVF